MTFAFVFDSVGAGEWLLLLAVLLVVMGPKRLPSTARTIGSYYAKFRRAADTFKRQLMDMDYEMEREMERARREAESAVSIPDGPPETESAGQGYSPPDPVTDYPVSDAAPEVASQTVPEQNDGDRPPEES